MLLCIAAAIPLPLGARPPTAPGKYVSDPEEMTEFDHRRGTPTRQPKIIDLAVAAANLSACEEGKGPEAVDLLASGTYTSGAIQDSQGNWVDVIRPQLPSEKAARREAAAAPPPEVQAQPEEQAPTPPQAQTEAAPVEKAQTETAPVEKHSPAMEQAAKETKEAKEKAKALADDLLPMHLMSQNSDDGSLDEAPAPKFSNSATPEGDQKLFFDWLPWRRQGAPEFDKSKDKGEDLSKEDAKNKEELDFRTERVANQNKFKEDEEKQEKQEEADKQKLAAHKRNLVNKKLPPSSESTQGSVAADLQHREARASLGNKHQDDVKKEEQQAEATTKKSKSESKIATQQAKTESKKVEEEVTTETKKDKEEAKTETKKVEEEVKSDAKKASQSNENKLAEQESDSKSSLSEAQKAVADAKSDKLAAAPKDFDYDAFAKESYAAIKERKLLMEQYARQRFETQLAAAKKGQQAQEAAAAIAMAKRQQLVDEDFQSRQAIADAMRNGQPI